MAAMDSTLGVRSVITRQRERIVNDTSSGCVDGVHNRKTVRRRRLLDGFQQSIARRLRQPIGILHEDNLPATSARRGRRPENESPHLADTNRQALGHDKPDVRMRARERRMALATHPAATLTTLQGGGEGSRRHRPARPRRPCEQPRMRHGADRGVLARTVAAAAATAPDSTATAWS